MRRLRVLDLFSGIGGFTLGLERAGMETIAFCEIDIFCRQVLKKNWPDVPVYNDIRELTKDDIPGPVDIICGGFPCQDVSVSGKRQGLSSGTRSGLWSEQIRLVREVRPAAAIIENVPGLLTCNKGGAFARLLCDLAEIGFDAQWFCISAAAIGACHYRERLWLVAYPSGSELENMDIAESLRAYQKGSCSLQFAGAIDAAIPADAYIEMRGDYDDVSGEMERIKQYGNAVVPQIPEIIGRAIIQAMD